VFHATPFRETIKLEADMMLTSFVDHWWNLLRNRDIVVSTGARDWKDQRASARHYRRVFDANNLPDVYNAITYWRRSETAQEFFNTVQSIFENWTEYRKLLKFPEDVPSTDVVYAMAANIIGPELCTMPFADYPRIVHMKRAIAGTQREQWQDELVWEYKNYMMRVNGITQWGAFHYNVKDLHHANR
jgi:dTDP-D-glucose 4,6-dehydratase